jgi:hypothetical protein
MPLTATLAMTVLAVMITAQAWLLLGPHPSGPGAAPGSDAA